MLAHEMRRQYRSNQSRQTTSIFVLFLVVALLGGCVSSSSYEEVSKERDALLKKQSALEGNTRLLRNKVETTEEKVAHLKSELAAAEARLSVVNSSLEERNKKLVEASRMLDEKNARLSMASEELERRQAELRQTESRLAESNKKLQTAADYMEKTNKLSPVIASIATYCVAMVSARRLAISESSKTTSAMKRCSLFPSTDMKSCHVT